jgi:hypothetical protein
MFLGRIVDIGAELFAMSATVVRAEMLRREDPAQGVRAYELADLFCKQARLRVDELFHRLWANTDDESYKVAMDVLDGKHIWSEAGALDPSGAGPLVGEPAPGSENVHRTID